MSLDKLAQRKREALEEALKEEQEKGTLSPFLKVNEMGDIVDLFDNTVNTLTEYREAIERKKIKDQNDGSNFLYNMSTD